MGKPKERMLYDAAIKARLALEKAVKQTGHFSYREKYWENFIHAYSALSPDFKKKFNSWILPRSITGPRRSGVSEFEKKLEQTAAWPDGSNEKIQKSLLPNVPMEDQPFRRRYLKKIITRGWENGFIRVFPEMDSRQVARYFRRKTRPPKGVRKQIRGQKAQQRRKVR